MYNPKEIEKKWQKFWEENNTFKTFNPSEEGFDGTKEKFYVLDMFPYPSGDGLHVGHPEGFTANDILARYKKTKGFNVLHPMGRDAFGLPAENYAIKTGTHPKITTAKNIETFKRQIKSLGFSYDWDREIDTTDPEYYKWTQWIFLKMFEAGLAYEQDLPINYCPSCKTGLANEEVLNDFTCERCGTKVEKKQLRQWVLAITKYADRLLADVDKLDWPESIKEMQRNWIGKSEGTEFKMEKDNDKDKFIEVYTTRIDTVFGMTYAVLAPDHPKVWDFITPEQKEVCQSYIEEASKKSDQDRTADNKEKTGVFTGSYVINPFNNSPVPLWIGDYVLGNYGTGAVMAVPAHDSRDFEFAKKYDLEIIPTVYPKEIIEKYRQQSDEIFFSNLNQEEADKHILETQKLEDEFFENLPFTEDGFIGNVNYSVEKEEDLGKAEEVWKKYFTITSKQARQDFTKFAEENGFGKKKINYKLRDWLFSRQRYWGEPIPLIHLKTEDVKNLPRLSEEEFDILNKKIENLIHKKMKVATPKMEEVVHNDNSAKPSSESIILNKVKKVKKKSKKIKLKTYYNEKKIADKIIIFNGRYLLEHFRSKSKKEVNLRKRNFSTIVENIEKIFFISENIGILEINGFFWLVFTEKFENKKYNLLTYYPFKKLNSLLENKAYVLKTEKIENSDSRTLCSKGQEKSLVINGKIISKIYSGIYGDIICDYNLPLELPEISSYEPAGDGNSPLARVSEFVNVKLASNLEGKRETNTMPQWGGSCWYYLRYMDNKNSEEIVSKEAEFYWDGVDSYVGGAEHAVLHLLYARFWHKFLFDIGVVKTDEPFHKLRNQGLILAHAYERQNGGLVAVDLVEEKDGKYFEISTGEEVKKIVSKMSKSLKNVVNPDDIVNEYGADSLRLYEMYMADFKDSAPWDTKGIIGVVRFLEKAERLFTFEAKISTESDEETMKLLHKTIKKVEEDIENYKFNTAIAALMILVNNGLPKDENLQKEWKNIFARLLHPFAPHLAEEFWERINKSSEIIGEISSVYNSSWPKYDEKMIVDNEVTIGVQVMGKVRGEIKIGVSEDKDSVLAKAKANENVKKWIDGKEIVKEIYVPGKILNIVVK